MTFYVIALGVGVALGGTFGFRMGRTYERVRPKTKKKKKTKKGR